VARLLSIRAREGDFETSLHESAGKRTPEPPDLREDFRRGLLQPLLHDIAERHKLSHPGRAVIETYLPSGRVRAQTLEEWSRLEHAVTNVLANIEAGAATGDPIEIITGHDGDNATIAIVDHHRGGEVERDLALWHTQAHGEDEESGGFPGLRACRETLESIGAEMWSAFRPGGSVLFITIPGFVRTTPDVSLPIPFSSRLARQRARKPSIRRKVAS
jgi:hypothetical protein